MLVQDLIVNSLWLMSLVTVGSDLSLTLGYSLGTHCSIVRYNCFELLRYACSATLPSHCIHYITLGLHCIPQRTGNTELLNVCLSEYWSKLLNY